MFHRKKGGHSARCGACISAVRASREGFDDHISIPDKAFLDRVSYHRGIWEGWQRALESFERETPTYNDIMEILYEAFPLHGPSRAVPREDIFLRVGEVLQERGAKQHRAA